MIRRHVVLVAAISMLASTLMIMPLASRASADSPASCATSQLQPIASNNTSGEPILLVHGITSSPAVFDHSVGGGASLAKRLEALAGVSVWTFDYHSVSLDWVTNPSIGPALATAIGCLESSTGYHVAIVDHSMGGLATQYAMAQNDDQGSPDASNVSGVITIGTPFEGSKLLSAIKNGAGDIKYSNPVEGATIQAYLSYCAGRLDDNFCPLTNILDSPVGTALEYDSPQIRSLPKWPSYVPVFDIAGNMQLKVNIGPLHFTGSVGDGAGSVDSATAHDTTGQPLVITCPVTLLHPMQTLACEHTVLPHNATVVGRVVTEVEKLDGIDTQTATTTTSTTAPTSTGPSASPAATLLASDSSGDSIASTFSVGPPKLVSASGFTDATLSNCDPMDPSRSVATKIVINTRATSSLTETVDFSFLAPLTNPGSMSFVMDYSNGAQCDAESAGLAGVSFKVGPNAPNTFTMYAIDIDAVSPDTPAGDLQALGDWLIQQPSLTIEGNAAGGPFWGPRVITCEGDINNTSYLVPAGQLPASINTGLSSDSCSPQLTQNQ